MWVFGYGSLIWKVDFPFEKKELGFITGYQRRFYQHSTDHRGTPESPGRVVTLVPAPPDSRVYGVAYKIKEEEAESVMGHLDYREKGGYEKRAIDFHPIDQEHEPFEIIVYLGTDDNVNFAGYADDDSIAQQVFQSVGPSGPNIDYVLNLAKTFRTLFPGVDDSHLFSIESKLLQLLHSKEGS